MAALLLLAALVPRHYAAEARLLVVCLDGAELTELRRRAAVDGLDTLAGLLGSGVGGSLRGQTRLYGAEFWRSLFTVSDSPWQLAVGATGEPLLWELDGRGVVVVGLPGVEPGPGNEALVVPGARPAQGYIGDSTGQVVSRRAAKAGGLEWPYVIAGGQLLGSVEALGTGEWGPWLDLAAGDGRSGIFRVLRLGRDALYLSPVYRRHMPGREFGLEGEAGGLTYVADIPSWAGASSRLEDYYGSHLRDLTAVRAEAATALVRRDWRMFVYHEPLLLAASAAYRTQPERLDEAYRIIDKRVAGLLEAAGSGLRVLVLAGPGIDPASRGFMWLADGKPGRSEQPMSRREVAATVAELAGLELGAVSGQVSAAVLARNWQFEAWRKLGRTSRPGPATVELDAERMREMGILATTASVPAPEQ